MQLRLLPTLRLPVRPFFASSPRRYLLALSTASTLTLTACGVSYASDQERERESAGEQAETAAVALPASPKRQRVTVDNSDAGFRLFVEPGYHQIDRSTEAWSRAASTLTAGSPSALGEDSLSAPTGYLDSATGSGPDGAQVAAIALWEASLPAEAADYTIYAYVVPSSRNSQYASYCFSMGTTDEDQETQDCGLVDQSSGPTGWRALATLSLSGKAQVWLDPGATLESGKQVVADAVAFVPADGE